jgi:RimJ/RimL family protein N-acetyltransferase
MELTDGTLVLRAPEDGDAAAIHTACQDPEIPRWIPVIPQPYTQESARDFVTWSRETFERGSYSFVIVDARTGELLGAIGMGVNSLMKIGHIGYWVAASARRRGIASSALRLLAGWALEQDFGRVELITDPDNIASQRVAEKVGFGREGVMRAHTLHRDGRRRDAVLFSLLPGELV